MSRTGFKRILLKLSGEVLMGTSQYGIDPIETARIAGEIKLALAMSNAMPGNVSSSLTLEVADLDAALAAVKAAGAPVAYDVMEFPPCRIFGVKDPDGNQIGLHQRKAS